MLQFAIVALRDFGSVPPEMSRERRNRGSKKKEKEETIPIIIISIVVVLLFVVLTTSVVITLVVYRHQKKKKLKQQKSVQKAVKKPRKMASQNLNVEKFTHVGPLVLDPKLKGPVVHAVEDTCGASAIQNVQFDPRLNEIVDIGSNIEVLKDNGQTTTEVTVDEKASVSVMKTLRLKHFQKALGKSRAKGDERRAGTPVTPAKAPQNGTPVARSVPRGVKK
ncbi:hypothetical protein RB195_019900 [Necator americanus]|uniref:Uncharacterized protein n=1 Tax=Necator americanus TaxID=51031 RepID=A0ABR1CJ35_NECAM